MPDSDLLVIIVVAALATFATRLLPFVLFANHRPGKFLTYLEKNMPVSIMVVLIFYSLKDVPWSQTYGYPELLAIGVAVVLHLSVKNALLSIVCATGTYMMIL